MDIEVKRLENEIKRAYFIDKPRMTRQGADDDTNELEDYHEELINLLPWLRPHITKHSNQGSTLHMTEHAVPTATRTNDKFLRTILEGEMKPCIGGATT